MGSSDPALSGDELVSVEHLGDQDRLQHAVNGDACGEGLESLLLDALAWLIGIAADPGDGDLDWRSAGGARLRDQGSEAASQAGVALDVGRGQRAAPSEVGRIAGPWISTARCQSGDTAAGRPSRSRNSAANAA